jgi:hypothetical protein
MSTGSDRCDAADPCIFCRTSLHNECILFWGDNLDCGCGGEVIFTASGEIKQLNADSVEELGTTDTGYINDGYESAKDLADYKDPISTGRKRAKEMYPITAGMTCEWAGLKFAGGGSMPIVGCIGRPASDRHHGPDKNTMNNAPTNLHRICDFCHNTWHALNDPYYGERPDHTKPFLPIKGECKQHDPKTMASMDELLAAEKERMLKQ